MNPATHSGEPNPEPWRTAYLCPGCGMQVCDCELDSGEPKGEDTEMIQVVAKWASKCAVCGRDTILRGFARDGSEWVPASALAQALETLDRLSQATAVARSTPEPHDIADNWATYNKAWEEVEAALVQANSVLAVTTEERA